MSRWNGRIAFVSGASRGIGAEICRRLVKRGMIVIGCARSVKSIKAIAEESLIKNSTGQLHAMKCDLSNEVEILDMFKEIRLKFDHVDVCVNNSGFSTTSSFTECATKDLKNLLEVNIMAVGICTRECLKLMNNIEEGMIIQVVQCGSVIERREQLDQWTTLSKPPSGYSMYISVNSAIRALTEALRQELESRDSRIRAVCITQDSVVTQFLFGILKEEEAKSRFKHAFHTEANVIAGHVISVLEKPTGEPIDEYIIGDADFLKDHATQVNGK